MAWKFTKFSTFLGLAMISPQGRENCKTINCLWIWCLLTGVQFLTSWLQLTLQMSVLLKTHIQEFNDLVENIMQSGEASVPISLMNLYMALSNRSLLWMGVQDLKQNFTTAKFCLWVEDSSILGGNSLVVDGLVHLNFVEGSLYWIRPLVEGNTRSGTTLSCHLAWSFGNTLVLRTLHYPLYSRRHTAYICYSHRIFLTSLHHQQPRKQDVPSRKGLP
jgi:hypothetical protein